VRLLHLSSRYWPGYGGGESYIQEVSERLVAEGHQLTVATSDAAQTELFWNPHKSRLPQLQAEQAGVRILRFPLRHLPLAPLSYSVWRYIVFWFLASRPGVPLPWLMRLCRYTPWVPELWRWVETTPEKFDAIGAMSVLYEPFVAAAQQLAARLHVPFLIYPLTHLGASRIPGQDPVARYYTMRHQIELVRRADRVITMTPTEAQFYEDRGVPRERLCVAGAGVNPAQVLGGNAERFRTRHAVHGPLVTFLSAMLYDKGAIPLVEAVRQLWQQGQAVELVMAGTVLDPFRRYLAQLPSAERERIRLLGTISEDDKRDLLAASDIVAMPSRTDSFGIIYLEAWLYRKPVIGAKAWGITDVIEDGQDGLLVPFGDVPALAQAIRTLLENPELRMTLGARGEAKVLSTYTWDVVYARLRKVYSSLEPPQRRMLSPLNPP